MKWNNVEHIFFDLDHTLWDFDKNSELAFDLIFKKNKIEVELSEFLAVYIPLNEYYWKLYRENKVSQKDLRFLRLKESFDSLKIVLENKIIETLALDYIQHLPKNNFLLEGVEEILPYLARKYKLHIITNGFKEVQYLKLENSGIFNFFSSITTSEEAGAKKPDKEIFHFALRTTGAEREKSVMIGDNLEADIIGAVDFGMRTMLFNYKAQEFPLHYFQIKKLKEIPLYL